MFVFSFSFRYSLSFSFRYSLIFIFSLIFKCDFNFFLVCVIILSSLLSIKCSVSLSISLTLCIISLIMFVSLFISRMTWSIVPPILLINFILLFTTSVNLLTYPSMSLCLSLLIIFELILFFP